jgi:hypothetical protein
VMRWTEAGLRALRGTRLSEQEKLSCILLVDVYVRGQVQLTGGMAGVTADDERAADELYARRLGALVDAERFPEMSAALLSGSLSGGGDFAEEEFGFGLQTVLDGIAVRAQRAARYAPSTRSR